MSQDQLPCYFQQLYYELILPTIYGPACMPQPIILTTSIATTGKFVGSVAQLDIMYAF